MSEMIERVARAICEVRLNEGSLLDAIEQYLIEYDYGPATADDVIARIGRAAISAMLEPTERMVDAGHDEAPMCEFGVPLTKPCREFNRAAYTAMISAALAEGEA